MNRLLHPCLIIVFCLALTSLPSYGQTRPKVVIGYASMSTVAIDGLDDYVKRVDRKPYVAIEGLRNIQRFMKLRNPKIAELKLERLIDDSILRELDKSGFIDQVYAAKPVPQ